MDRITGTDAANLMEAYAAVYTPKTIGEKIWEDAGYLTEEFIFESYQSVAEYLLNNDIVQEYDNVEFYISEMALEDIDFILFEMGILDEQYLIEAGFFQNIGAGADRFISGAKTNIQRTGQTVAGAAKRAGSVVSGGAQRVVGTAQRAGQTALGTAQRAAGVVQRTASPVAQAIQGTAQRAASAVSGGAQRAAGAVTGAAQSVSRRVGQELEISRRVGAGEPTTPSTTKTTPSQSRFANARDAAFARARQIQGSPVVGPRPTSTPSLSPARRSAPQPGTPSQVRPQPRPQVARPVPSYSGATGVKPVGTPLPTNAVTPVSGIPTQNAPVSLQRPVNKLMSGMPIVPSMAAPVGGPALSARARALKAGGPQGGARERVLNLSSFDPFDVVMGYLIDEGYAENEDAAAVIMANMSEEWKESILEQSNTLVTPEQRRAD